MPPITAQNAGTQDGAASAPPAEEDFDAALSALIEDKTAPALSAAESPVEGNDAGAAAEPAPSFDDAANAPAAGDEPPANEPSNDDIWSNADPALREAHQRELRDANLRLAGIQGRQSAADREVHRLRKELAELRAQDGSGVSGESQQPRAGGNDAKAGRRRDFSDNFPEVAEPVYSEIDEVEARLSELERPIRALEQERIEAEYRRQQSILKQKHPDWKEVAGDERINGWVQSQPKGIQEMFARNSEHDRIVDGEEAALVVSLFKADLGIGGPPSTPKPSPKVDDRRAQQLAAGRDIGRTGPPVTTGVPDDLDAAIALYANKHG